MAYRGSDRANKQAFIFYFTRRQSKEGLEWDLMRRTTQQNDNELPIALKRNSLSTMNHFIVYYME